MQMQMLITLTPKCACDEKYLDVSVVVDNLQWVSSAVTGVSEYDGARSFAP